MYCLIDFCCICFYNKEHLQPLSSFASDNITYFVKLTSSVPEMCFNQMNNKRLICNKCCETIDAAYKFRQRCLRSKIMLTNYISQLQQISNISGVANVYLTDLNKFVYIKEYQEENNMETTEMFINVNENIIDENFVINPTIKIKRENNPITLKLIDTGNNYIQLENVIIKMEQKNQNSDEDIEETLDNILVNQNDNKIDISQNDIKLTASAIKKENEKQNFEERLQEKFDNILETFNSENDDTAVKVEESENYPLYSEKYFDDFVATLDEKKIDIVDNNIEEFLIENDEISLKNQDKVKVEENNDYPLYSEEYFDDPSAILDDLKIDIVANDIESMNNEINIQYKSEAIEEFSTEDNDLPWEDENKTDKEVNFSYKILKTKQEKTLLSKKSKEKMCGTVNRKDKIVKKHECSICKKNFLQSSSLECHMNIHTEEKLKKCDVCQQKFSNLSKLRYHMIIHNGKKTHDCDVCQKKFTQSCYLKKHMRIHNGEKPYECDVCHKKFTQSSNLKRHKRIHTGEKLYTCDVCQKKFNQLNSVKQHKRIHTGEKPYECDVCQKKFIQLSSLIYHKKIHTGENLHECSVCQKKFRQSSHLREHTLIHTGVKPYKCDVCQKKFVRSFNLRMHMLIHTGEKRYECDTCQKMFSQACHLRNHALIHTEEKSHGCDLCQKKFIRSDYLKKHMRIHIGERIHNNIVISDEIQ